MPVAGISARCRRIGERAAHGSRRVQLRCRQRGPEGDAGRVIPGDYRSGLGDGDLYRLGDTGVVGGVGRGEGHREVSVPVAGVVPAAGVYANVPPTEAVAFNCVADSVVPKGMLAGLFQVITGVAWVTVICTVLVDTGVVGGVGRGEGDRERIGAGSRSTAPAAGVVDERAAQPTPSR